MRIKHTPNEFYYLQNYLPCTSNDNAHIKRWWTYKTYATKQSALNALKRIKEKYKNDDQVQRLIWRILWFPYPFADYDKSICVYTEEENENNN